MLFFFNETATTEIYTLSLHDALPISPAAVGARAGGRGDPRGQPGRGAVPAHRPGAGAARAGDRKSTRLNSSHANISYAVFCLKKKHNTIIRATLTFLCISRTSRYLNS